MRSTLSEAIVVAERLMLPGWIVEGSVMMRLSSGETGLVTRSALEWLYEMVML